jgi:hypothetical protein
MAALSRNRAAYSEICPGFLKSRSDGVGSLLPGPDTDRLLDRYHEDLAVADLVGAGGIHDRLNSALDEPVIEHDLDFDLGQEVDHVLRPAIDFRVALLPAEALDLGDRHAGNPDFVQRVLHLVELEGLDDRFDLLQRFPIRCRALYGLGLGGGAALG